jgi:hypothetical protein
MLYELIGKFGVVILCAPGIVPAVIFYKRHCKETPHVQNRFPLGLYVVALLICAFVAFWGGTEWGVRFGCSGSSSGNLCGLLGFIVIGPLSSIAAVSVLSWLITYSPRQMKRLVLAGVLLFLVAGGYYFRGFFFDIVMHRDLYQYKLQSGNLDELHRFAPVVEAQMRRLPVIVIKDVSVDSQLKSQQAIVDVDRQEAAAPDVTELPTVTMTISFSPASGVVLGDAFAKIQDMERRLALPATITTSLAKAPTIPIRDK